MWLEEQDSKTFRPGRYFLEKLADYKENNPEADINLVAHSAGSVAMCHLLDTIAAQFNQLNINYVIFTAPTATFEQFYQAVVTKTERYKQFTLFTMSDEHEQQDATLPHVYPSSMLYLVSGVLEKEVDHPISGMMRFFTGKAPFNTTELETAREFLLDPNEERLVISKRPPTRSGFGVETVRHRDFDKDERMLHSIRYMLDGKPAHQ